MQQPLVLRQVAQPRLHRNPPTPSRHEADLSGDACVDGFRIMRTVVGTLPAFGQCRRNGKVEKLVISRRDLTNREALSR